jgi:hypothetical protein
VTAICITVVALAMVVAITLFGSMLLGMIDKNERTKIRFTKYDDKDYDINE